MMMDVIPSLTALNMVFQKQDLGIAAVQPAIDFFLAVDGASTGKSYYQRELKSLLKKCDGNTMKLKDVKLDLDLKTVIKTAVDQDSSGMTPVVSKALVSRSAYIAEFALAKRFILEQRYPRDNTFELWKIVNEHHKDQFPNLIRLVKIAMHMPLQTADCDRGFSAQNHIHTATRNKLSSETVNKLMLIRLQHGPAEDFDFQKAAKHWKEKKERRLFKA